MAGLQSKLELQEQDEHIKYPHSKNKKLSDLVLGDNVKSIDVAVQMKKYAIEMTLIIEYLIMNRFIDTEYPD